MNLRKLSKSRNHQWQIFGTVFSITALVWLLRGFEILTFIPGGVIWLLLLLTITIGVLISLPQRWIRF